ncbi:hypothetical protein KVF89_22335 [Nocardioides carbamazepini]|uniref:hypothetical protein n=1 Tax=Nocardioides carbamazepini TaxID=2854259 RepID=UPI00214A0452|nr:hypothetical protein [Nocardioides carbamazepini]MCR1785295.1 hypothetical protein [Nocardioides carbamazepini]
MTTADVSWGALDFMDPEAAPPAEGFLIHAMADETGLGNPKAITQVIKSLLTDGSLAVLEGWDNREIKIHLRFSPGTAAVAGPALAAAEAALFAQVLAEAKAPLVYTPPAEDAPVCVFDVVAAELERDYSGPWDLDEEMRAFRYYLLTLVCLPFVRGLETTVAPALPVPPVTPTTVSIDACTSLTGWTAGYTTDQQTWPGTPVLAESGQAVQFQHSSALSFVQRNGAVAMGATPYLVVDATGEAKLTPDSWVGGPEYISVRIDGVPIQPVATSGTLCYFRPPPSFTTLHVRGGILGVLGTRVTVRQISRTDTIPGSGTNRQLSRTVTVAGSAPTTAAIRLFDATPAALGTDILVFSSRNLAWKNALRPYRITSAAVTGDATMVSGARNTLSTPMICRFAASLLTEGTYALMAKMLVSTAGSFGWSARMVSSSGGLTVGSSVTVAGSVTVPTTGGVSRVLNLGALPLPVIRAEADQMVELTLTGTPNMTLDEGWLHGLHDGALTWLQDSDSMTWLEIRSPELGAARPSVYGGTGAKGTGGVCVDWKCQSFGAHRFEPGPMAINTVTTSSLASQSEIEFYERGFGHMAA